MKISIRKCGVIKAGALVGVTKYIAHMDRVEFTFFGPKDVVFISKIFKEKYHNKIFSAIQGYFEKHGSR